MRTVRVDGGNLRQLITILVHVKKNPGQQEPRLKRLYIDYDGIHPENWGPIWKYEIDCVKSLADKQNVPFDSTAFQFENGILMCKSPESELTIRKFHVQVIALLFSTDTFPEMVQLACHKDILEMFRGFKHKIKNMVSSLALRDSASREPKPDSPLSWDQEIVSILSDSMPAKHLFLEGPIVRISNEEGHGLRNHSDITFYKISPGSAQIGHLIDLRATKLSAFRYIAEDHQERIGEKWKDPLIKILGDLNSTQGECLKTLCLGLFNAPRGYSGLAVPPSMGLLQSLTHLWIDSGKSDARWKYEAIRSFALPNHYAQNLFHLRITGPREDLDNWISFMLTGGKSVWEHLKSFSINDETLVEQNSQSLESVGVKLKLIGENDDIRLWTNEGDNLEEFKDDKRPSQYFSKVLN
ncbi:hypothetical protein CPAR01_12123 [Colletotrichum paranaense]|uniref:Uncharacterized protein n=1 Tax=Colletotrichum paranaense TaxID=1914294 RepID=A0ABQ9S9T9_9PEZI|nr:uncharacterized protein CPAR01_12123 [Colletotrichum paranaense]KAK1529811.1 hypothetical protein CPAR01_12123 [Colletotrichum paranaense]